jgi:hypothetical protein
VKLANFREKYIFQGLNLLLGQNKGKFIERISDFQGESPGYSDYDVQYPALSFHGYAPDTSLKIKVWTKLNNQISISPIHVFFWWHQTLYILLQCH